MDHPELANYMPEDHSYDGTESIIKFYKRKYRPLDSNESVYQMVALMTVTKIYTGNKDIIQSMHILPRVLADIRIMFNNP